MTCPVPHRDFCTPKETWRGDTLEEVSARDAPRVHDMLYIMWRELETRILSS